MSPSVSAAGVVQRAKLLRPSTTLPGKIGGRALPAVASAVAESDADSALTDGAIIHAHLHTGTASANVAFSPRTDGPRTLTLKSGAAISLALQNTTTASAEYANGYLVYRGALTAGGDAIIRPSRDGFEDHFYFEKKPATSTVEYLLTLPAGAGLRLSSNVLEVVDGSGTPLVHASPPSLVDAGGKTTSAILAVSGCAVDSSEQPSWGRKPIPPGAPNCRVSVSWSDTGIQYPAVLDPNWSTAGTMAVPRGYFGTAILTKHSPQFVVAFGGSNLVNTSNVTEFFNVDSGTWSPGPPLNVARYGGASVVYNSTGTPTGDKVFVSGGFSANVYERTTEILSSDANGNYTWSLSAPMQSPRAAHTATLVNNQILIAGGQNSTIPSQSSCELFDIATSAFVTPAPPDMNQARSNFNATLLADGQSVLITGGFGTGGSSPPTAELFSAGQWHLLSNMPSPHTNHVSLLLNDGRVLVIGGDDSQVGFSNQADLYTYASSAPYGSWSSAGTFSSNGRSQAPVAMLSNGAALFSSGFVGVGTTSGTNTTDASLFDPKKNSWSATTTTISHSIGGAAAVTKSSGDQETILFGGFDANWAAHGVTEVFTTTATGGTCAVGPECATGICDTAVCVPPGLPVTIDATALSNKGLVIAGSSATILDITQPRQVRLVAGSYSLQVYSGLTSVAAFTVNSNGTITYDPTLEGVLSGNGTKTLKVNGRRISVNATHLSQTQLQLLVYHYSNGAEVDKLPFATNAVQSFTLLPLTGFGYQFDVDGSSPADLSFNIDLAGYVHIPSTQTYVATGEGTTTLTIGGVHVSLTIPQGLGNATLAGGATLPQGQTTDLYLLPYSGGSPFNITIAGGTTTFSVDSSGDVIGDPLLLNILKASGDGAPFCSSDDMRSEENAWTGTPLNCRGAARSSSAGSIDGEVPDKNPAARLGGPGRPPNQLPRYRKAAGGDPVLGDGEFFMQRVDASLAGAGLQYQFRRTYRSGMEMNGPLGVGWDHNFDQRILGQVIMEPQSPSFDPTTAGDIIGANCDGTVQFQDGEGNLELFTNVSTGWTSIATLAPNPFLTFVGVNSDLTLEFHWSLGTGASYWKLNMADGTVSLFDQAGFLKSVTDVAGNSLNLTWQSATAPPMPESDCAAIQYADAACSVWFSGLVHSPIGQRRRLMSVTDAARTVYYVYSQQDTQTLQPTDRLLCISLNANDCVTSPLVHFNYDSSSRLSGVSRGGVEANAIEGYLYHAVATDPSTCIASADLPNYCTRLCSAPVTDCNAVDYQNKVATFCRSKQCASIAAQEDCPATSQLLTKSGQSTFLCCKTDLNAPADNLLCTNYLFGGPSGANCSDGCLDSYQCQDTRNGTQYAIYAGGAAQELNNDITDVYDNRGQLVVHNVYGEDRSLVSFDRVISQQINSASTDNVITFEYHDLLVEKQSQPLPVFTAPSGPAAWTGLYSTPDPTGNVQRFQLPLSTRVDICPHACPGGGTACNPTNYAPASEDPEDINPEAMTWAVVIHDLHGRTRLQYLDQAAEVLREVALDTNELTDYQYSGGLLAGVREPSGVRTCLERDLSGRVTQSSVVPVAGFLGSTVTQATTMAYNQTGQLTDVVRDVFGTPVKTHYQRDTLGRVQWIDQDVRSGSAPLRTLYVYDGETPPAGILETPTQITYPNGRVDKFSQFDASMGGPQTITIDATSAVPEHRYAIYDSFGRVKQEGEVNRFSNRYQYTDRNDIWRLSSTGHQLDSTKPWIDVTVSSHLVDAQTVVDSVVEATRTTNFTNVGQFATEKDLVATVAPANTTLPTTQTSCFNYSPDGRLEAGILPEGNGILNTYLYSLNGTTIETNRGFGVDTSGVWAAGCRGRTAPANDPGMGLPSTRTFLPGGFPSSEIDDNQVARQFLTDGFGRVLQISTLQNPAHPDPLPVQQFGYDSAGHRIWEASRTSTTTAYGKPTLPDASVLGYAEYDYDLTGRVTAQRSYVLETGEILTKTFAYDDLKGAVAITDRGVTTTMVSDGRGRLTSTTLPDTSVTSIVHQLGVDVATVQSNSNGNVSRTFNYDTRGRLLNIQDSKSALLYQGTYDDDGNQLTETRAGQGLVTWSYDAFDRLVREDKTISASPSTIATSTYAYDRNDRLTTYADPVNAANPWKMTFTGTDAPLTVTDPLARVGTYTYPTGTSWPRNLVANMLEPNGRLTSFQYDSNARLTDVYNGTCPTARNPWECDNIHQVQRHMTYDARGSVAEIDAPNRSTVTLNHDSLGRVVDDIVGVTGSQSKIHHTFLDAGRTETTAVSYNVTTLPTMTHRYDSMGRLQTVGLSTQTAPLATYAFGVGMGGPLSLTYSNGAKAAYTYDAKLRQTGIDVTFTKPGTTTSTFVASLHEAVGADSIPRMRQHRVGTAAAKTDVFQVDLDGRITGENLLLNGLTLPSTEVSNSDVQSTIQFGANWRQYSIDKIGNIKQAATHSSTLVETVDNLSRLTAFGGTSVTHDATDNLNGLKGNTTQFTFDQFNGSMLTASYAAGKTSKFDYDAMDRRRVEHRPDGTDRLFFWDGNKIVAHGVGTNLSLDVPGDDIDSHIVTIDQMGKGSQWFYHQGADQSTLAVTGSAGFVESYTYSAFGELSITNSKGVAASQSAFGNIFQFQGQLFDALTGTYSMRARQYQPTWGRFLSPDPISTAGGPSLYSFTGARPLHNRDPSGLLNCEMGFSGCILNIGDANWGAALAAGGYGTTSFEESMTSYAVQNDGYTYADQGTGEYHLVVSGGTRPSTINEFPDGTVGNYTNDGIEKVFTDTVVNSWGIYSSMPGIPPSAAPPVQARTVEQAGQEYLANINKYRGPLGPFKLITNGINTVLDGHQNDLDAIYAAFPLLGGVVGLEAEAAEAAEGFLGSSLTTRGPLYDLGRKLAAEEAAGAFTATGELSPEAIQGSREIFAPGQLGNPNIPDGFGKWSTDTFNSPSGPFQVHFYQNATTGDIYYGLDYKSVFNRGIVPYSVGGQ